MRSAFFALALAAAGCDDTSIDVPVPPRPAARPLPSDPSCEAVARSKGAVWGEPTTLRSAEGSLILTDPSVFGGPFEPPLRLAAGAEVSVRVLTERGEPGARALCLQVRLLPGEPSSWKALGDVVIDTDMLLLGDERRLREALRPSEARVVPCVEGPAADLAALTPALAGRGLALRPVVPTVACADRLAQPSDRELVAGALREGKREGGFVLEPRPAAWPLLDALAERSWAPFPASEPAALVVEVRDGDGARSVRGGHDASGKLLLAEVPLL